MGTDAGCGVRGSKGGRLRMRGSKDLFLRFEGAFCRAERIYDESFGM